MATRTIVSAACQRGSHKQCRARVLNPDVRDPKERWASCECRCPHDRGEGAEAFSKAEAEGDVEKMDELARQSAN